MRHLVAMLVLCLANTGADAQQPPDSSSNAAQIDDHSVFGPDTTILQREVSPTVDVRVAASAPALVTYVGRLTITRNGKTQEEAASALEQAVTAARPQGSKVTVINVRRDAGRTTTVYVPPQKPADGGPSLPQPPGRAWIETATVEVEAKSRADIFNWAQSTQAPSDGGPIATVYAPSITERAADDDPAWEVATRAAFALAQRDARAAAHAAGGDIGKLLRVGIQRRPTVVDGKVEITISAQYVMRGK